MRALITGANGFVGAALAREVAARMQLGDQPVTDLLLTDLKPDSALAGAGVRWVEGSLADARVLSALFEQAVDVIFHLASVPGGMAEQSYALARSVNLDATLALLEACRAQTLAGEGAPRFVFASSIAVYGAALSSPVDEATPPLPLMTYGAQKLMGEVAVADFSHHGWCDGLSLRLSGVLARPPAPTGQMSAFLSDIIHAVSRGTSYVCPVSASATTWASSIQATVRALMHAASVNTLQLSPTRAVLLPTRCFAMEDLVEAIGRVHGVDAHGLVQWQAQEQVEQWFGRFPPVATPLAEAMGFCADADLDALVRSCGVPVSA